MYETLILLYDLYSYYNYIKLGYKYTTEIYKCYTNVCFLYKRITYKPNINDNWNLI